MKKALKTVLIILLVVIIVGAAIAGYFIWRHNSTYIGKEAAVSAALTDAGLDRSEVRDLSAEFEKERSAAWYEVEFQTFSLEYDYSVDAVTGEILSSHSQPEHAD